MGITFVEHLLCKAYCLSYIICAVGSIIPILWVRNRVKNFPKDICVAIVQVRIHIQIQPPSKVHTLREAD